MSKRNVFLSVSILILILMMAILICFPGDGEENDLDYIFPSDGLEDETNRDQLANWFLEGFNISNDLVDPWKTSNESCCGMNGFVSYQYNVTEEITLRLIYINGYFTQLELFSRWGVYSDPVQNIHDIASIISVNMNDPNIDTSKISSSYVPNYNPKYEIRGYYNISSTNDMDKRGFTNSNSIDFREVPRGEHTYSQITINAWYSGIHSFAGSEYELIEGSLDAFLLLEPEFKDRRLLKSKVSTINENKTTLYYPDFEPSLHINHHFEHEDEDSLYSVRTLTSIEDGSVISYEVGTITNSSVYWPEDLDPRVKGTDDPDIITLIISILTVVGVIATFLLILLFSVFVMANRRSKGIMDTLLRKRIFELIQKEPGIHFRQIMRELDIKQGVLGYHLNVLEQESYIRSIQKGVYRCFYGSDTKSVLHLKLNKAQQKILHEIDKNPGISLSKISNTLSKTKTLVYYHTSILNEAGLIDKEKDGKVTSFFITGVGKEYLVG